MKHVSELLSPRGLIQVAVVLLLMVGVTVIGRTVGMSMDLATIFGVVVGAALIGLYSGLVDRS